jgi:serine/threonine protein kinase
MAIWLQSNPVKKVNLNHNDFAAEGGEGQVYLLNDHAIKIYKDPSKCLLKGKLDELATLDHPQIIRPLFLAADDKGKEIGYAMKRLNETISLCKLFTNDFRDRVGFNAQNATDLVKEIENVLKHIHKSGCLMVDVNDMNIMVDEQQLRIPYFIDVDSYQTRSYPAAAIMPAVRDYQSQALSTLTDWYSFSILAFQLFVGIHPFKGTHAQYKRGDLEGRMKDSISVFNKDVTLPRTAREMSLIPSEYRKWFEALYVNGLRIEPPGVAGPINLTKPVVSIASGTALELILESEQIITIIGLLGDNLVTTAGVFDLKGRVVIAGDVQDAYIVSPVTGEIVNVTIKNKLLKLKTNHAQLPIVLAAQDVLVAGNNLFVRNQGQLTAVTLNHVAGKILPAAGRSWSVMPYATRIFDQVGFQNALGSTWIILPGSNPTPTCQILHVPELDGMRIQEARHDKGVVMALTGDSGKYDLHILRVDEKNGTYQIETEQDVDYHSPSFTVLDNGVVAHLRYDGKLGLFHRLKGAAVQQVFDDPRLTGNMRIASNGNRAFIIDNTKLYRLKTTGH